MMIAIKIFKKFVSMTMKKAKNIYKRHIKQCEKTQLKSLQLPWISQFLGRFYPSLRLLRLTPDREKARSAKAWANFQVFFGGGMNGTMAISRCFPAISSIHFQENGMKGNEWSNDNDVIEKHNPYIYALVVFFNLMVSLFFCHCYKRSWNSLIIRCCFQDLLAV